MVKSPSSSHTLQWAQQDTVTRVVAGGDLQNCAKALLKWASSNDEGDVRGKEGLGFVKFTTGRLGYEYA